MRSNEVSILSTVHAKNKPYCGRSAAAGKLSFSAQCIVVVSLLQFTCAQAEVLDDLADVEQASGVSQLLLLQLADQLDAVGIDVLLNLNDRTRARGSPDQPRLGRLADLSPGTYPDSDELRAAEAAYLAGDLVGVAMLASAKDVPASGANPAPSAFLEQWLQADEDERLFVSIASADVQHAAAIAAVSASAGWHALQIVHDAARQFAEDTDTLLGRLYATSRHRLSLDSRMARRYDGTLPDLAWLGERVRRNSDSIFRDSASQDDNRLARSEPAVFRKVTLGDEFSESTIREIVVPGGVALGEVARFNAGTVASIRFAEDELWLTTSEGDSLRLPELAAQDVKALFDFAQRSYTVGSDAIVDIDADSRVRINAALRDTEVGYQLMHADTIPFNYVDYLPVTKSVIIDTDVAWHGNEEEPGELQFTSEFEVRFLSADNMRLAQTRVAIVYDYDEQSQGSEFVRSWGTDASRLRENLDYSGLAKEVQVIARVAGWTALWRKLLADEVRFVEGRYEFMKIDTAGRITPGRYRP